MPLLVESVLRALGVHGTAVEHARLTDGEVGDIDHLLYFAARLCDQLAVLERDQLAELVLVASKRIAQQSHQLAPLGRRYLRPAPCCIGRAGHDLVELGGGGGGHGPEAPAVDRAETVDRPLGRLALQRQIEVSLQLLDFSMTHDAFSNGCGRGRDFGQSPTQLGSAR